MELLPLLEFYYDGLEVLEYKRHNSNQHQVAYKVSMVCLLGKEVKSRDDINK